MGSIEKNKLGDLNVKNWEGGFPPARLFFDRIRDALFGIPLISDNIPSCQQQVPNDVKRDSFPEICREREGYNNKKKACCRGTFSFFEPRSDAGPLIQLANNVLLNFVVFFYNFYLKINLYNLLFSFLKFLNCAKKLPFFYGEMEKICMVRESEF